jgi:hypothetical protein
MLPDEDEFITIKECCRAIGGKSHPIHPVTYYRGVAAGRYPAPEHPSPGISRVRKSKLLRAIERLVNSEAA